MHPAEAVSPHKCPAEVIAKADIKLTKAYPHLWVKWNDPADPNDDEYVLCKDTGLTDCKPSGFSSVAPGLIIIGTNGPNLIRGTEGDDIICGRGGNDLIKSGPGNDIVYGNGGKDTLIGETGNDTLYGGNGTDKLYGLDIGYENFDPANEWNFHPHDDDHLYGGNGKDTLAGGPRNDVLQGENGKDYLNGGEGLDVNVGGRADDNCVDIDDQSGQNDAGAAVDECADSEAADQ